MKDEVKEILKKQFIESLSCREVVDYLKQKKEIYINKKTKKITLKEVLSLPETKKLKESKDNFTSYSKILSVFLGIFILLISLKLNIYLFILSMFMIGSISICLENIANRILYVFMKKEVEKNKKLLANEFYKKEKIASEDITFIANYVDRETMEIIMSTYKKEEFNYELLNVDLIENKYIENKKELEDKEKLSDFLDSVYKKTSTK